MSEMASNSLSYEVNRCFRKGKEDEWKVMTLIESSIGGKCEFSSAKEDKESHIDLWWETPKGIMVSIDVKGLHKSKRSDSVYDDTICWLELQNVRGDKGWLQGEADYIAFMTASSVIFVKRQKLYEFALEKVDGTAYVTDTPRDFYVPYKREKWGRDDLMFKAPMKDIEKLSHFKVNF